MTGEALLDTWLGIDHTKNYLVTCCVGCGPDHRRYFIVRVMHGFGVYEGKGETLLEASEKAIKLEEECWNAESNFHYVS